ncbi:FAD-binding oxidoreductase [Arsenicitalea aurantiaca]|uniref:FAD-binding oxidoreductase n=1 Tax=Arsenicitalea aurantiaca TaxID=1783274 RepID=A0A433X8L2_9HYPH|nr:FAD-binding oxidoreductase [Arsenicitalea aurantiaca]RUT30415.1 FAD-binding oxidoreductase [Arsenicitalea aurantiaca]
MTVLPDQPVLRALLAALGDDGVLAGSRLMAARLRDASGAPSAVAPLALLRPRSVEEVSAALAICHAHDQPVVVQGGLTGLAAGANPLGGEIALSLARLEGIEDIDAEEGTMTLRAGTILQTAQDAARAAGFLLPIDYGARGSAHIGGAIATNAGGTRVIGHGTVRQNVLGLECVLMDGTVLSHLVKFTKDNSGYNLAQLFIGSEGTLGVVTRAVLRLKPLPPPAETALCALPDFPAALKLLRSARAKTTLSAFEVMWQDHFLLCGGRGLFSPDPDIALLIECEGGGLTDLLADAYSEGIVRDALIASSQAEADRFWDIRHMDHLETPLTHEINLDVSLPVVAMDGFARRCREDLGALDPDLRSYVFGHVGDGNLHVVVTLPRADPALVHRVEETAYGLVRALGGSISAEHGIGRLKRDWLDHSRSAAEIAAMRAIKAALDPKGLLNPGKII